MYRCSPPSIDDLLSVQSQSVFPSEGYGVGLGKRTPPNGGCRKCWSGVIVRPRPARARGRSRAEYEKTKERTPKLGGCRGGGRGVIVQLLNLEGGRG
jgi:hypothetical protein